MSSVDVSRGKPLMIPSALFERRSRYEPLSRPLMGLPLRRMIPTEVHAMMDYANAGTAAATAMVAETPEARFVGGALAAIGGGISLMTDYDLSLKKVIPIEVHEASDYVWAATAIAAPFLLGYWKRDRVAAAIQIFAGVTTLIGSLLTDYRSASR